MSNPGDHGSWHDPGGRNEHDGDPYGPPPAQDPWAQPQQPADQNPHGPSPYGEPGQSPYGSSGASPYGAPGGSPYGQQSPAFGPAGGPQQAAPGGEGQSRLVVGLLGIFLGSFGVHRFLLGYTTIGIIQVAITVLSCFTLSWAVAIWGIVEGILVLTKSPSFERDAHGRPLTD